MAIFLSDLLYRTIPDQVVYLGIMITIIYRIFENYHCHTTACGSSQGIFFLAGLGAAGFFYLLVLLTHFKGMGLGDVKLAGLMGLFLGFPQILVAFYLAFLTGATVGVILILVKRKKMKSQIAFGPFLVVATFMALFWGEKIIKILGY
jgi:leader peptidase (prepilin peptidase)/N-methyltransferase